MGVAFIEALLKSPLNFRGVAAGQSPMRRDVCAQSNSISGVSAVKRVNNYRAAIVISLGGPDMRAY